VSRGGGPGVRNLGLGLWGRRWKKEGKAERMEGGRGGVGEASGPRGVWREKDDQEYAAGDIKKCRAA